MLKTYSYPNPHGSIYEKVCIRETFASGMINVKVSFQTTQTSKVPMSKGSEPTEEGLYDLMQKI
jgi:hypothetical protein